MTERQKAVEAIQVIYPKHSKQAYSLASRPNETGVRFTAEAEKIRRGALGKPQRDQHRKRYKFMVRVTEERHRRVKQLIEADGYKTVNAWLDELISRWEKERAAPAVGATEAAKETMSMGSISPEKEKVNE